jgi:hypothetical protein
VEGTVAKEEPEVVVLASEHRGSRDALNKQAQFFELVSTLVVILQ